MKNMKFSLFLGILNLAFFSIHFSQAYTCSELAGRCTEDASLACYADEYNFSDGDSDCLAANPMSTTPYCCIEKKCTNKGSDYECLSSSPTSGYTAYSTGDNECRAKGMTGCFKKDTTANNACSTAGGICIDTESEICNGTILNHDCGEGYECCNSTNSDTCAGKGYKCISKNTTCNSPKTTYDSSCLSGEICCADSSSENNSSIGGIEIPETGLPNPSGGVQGIITNFLDWILTLFLILTLIAFAVTGIQYLFASGGSYGGGSIDGAKKRFQYSIIAVLIVGSSLIVVLAIDKFLNASPII